MTEWRIDIYFGEVQNGERDFQSFSIDARTRRSAIRKAMKECQQRNIQPISVCCYCDTDLKATGGKV